MEIYTPKKCKIQTKTHEMDVLEALEIETLESQSGHIGNNGNNGQIVHKVL